MLTEVITQPRPGEWLIHVPELAPRTEWFDHQYWLNQGRVLGANAGRGSAWMVKSSDGKWMLRHYFRGGMPARINRDKYLWQGLDKSRAIAEWRLLRRMRAEGLPVPAPVAARVHKTGWFYQADILMEYVPHERTFSRFLTGSTAFLDGAVWRQVGEAIGLLHGHGYFHADLNAHNILLAPEQAWLIDFDRGRYMQSFSSKTGSSALTAWQKKNLKRLRRSIDKVMSNNAKHPSGQTDTANTEPGARWRDLMDGYASGRQQAARRLSEQKKA